MNKAVNNTCKRSGSLVLQHSMFTLIKMTLKYINCKDYPDTRRAHKSKAQARNFYVFGGKAIALGPTILLEPETRSEGL